MSEGWIGVDLDGTLARYDGWNGGRIGAPIPIMVKRIKGWLAEGKQVKIVTARVGKPDPARVSNTIEKIEEMRKDIEDWCEEHIGERLEVTNEKDYDMLELWDDRAIQVEKNTGIVVNRYHGESGWLVEKDSTHLALGISCDKWCWVSFDEAIRFARKEDAERVGYIISPDRKWFACDHMWESGPCR